MNYAFPVYPNPLQNIAYVSYTRNECQGELGESVRSLTG